jgi:hypothetical protein
MSDVVEIVARALCPEATDETNRLTGDDGMNYPAGEPHWKAHIDDAKGLFSALDAAGYAVVPKEPTPEMIEAWDSAAPGPVSDDAAWTNENCARADYVAMLAAAPKVLP